MAAYSRKSGTRSYRRLFLVSTEGSVTEAEYFSRFESRFIHVECLREKGKSAPSAVLARIKREINRRRMDAGDYAWMVIDRDEWPPAEIDKLKSWVEDQSQAGPLNKGLALSNPKFELWLLLHFEDCPGDVRSYVERLARYMPGYSKHLDMSKIDDDAVMRAIDRAKAHWGAAPVSDWPREVGKTNVFRLCEEMIDANLKGAQREEDMWRLSSSPVADEAD